MLVYKLAAAVVVAVVLFGAGYMKGHEHGRIDQLQDTVDAYEERGKIDGDVQGLGAYDLCIELGGVPDQCQQLRGMDATAGSEQSGAVGR